jgi:hypothetical protein
LSTGLFITGLIAWFCGEPDIGCCLLAIAWIFHNGPADGDDDGSAREPIYHRPRVNPPATQGGRP